MSSTILLKGKYSGSSFQDIIDKDLNYCKFIESLKFASKEFKEFQDWLVLALPIAIEKHIAKELERIHKQLTH